MQALSNVLNPKTTMAAGMIVGGGLIALGLLANNSNPQNKTGLSPLFFDTTVVQTPLGQGEIKALWEQWRADTIADPSTSQPWAAVHVFNNCYDQYIIGGNYLSGSDTLFTVFGYNDIQTFITNFGSGYFLAIRTTNATNGLPYITLFKVCKTIDSPAPTVPDTTVTSPLTLRLSYVTVEDDSPQT